MARLRERVEKEVLAARVSVFPAPPIRGLGNAGGFKLMVEDRGNQGLPLLEGQADALAEKASQVPGFAGIVPTASGPARRRSTCRSIAPS